LGALTRRSDGSIQTGEAEGDTTGRSGRSLNDDAVVTGKLGVLTVFMVEG
jgi:hypothetical protein